MAALKIKKGTTAHSAYDLRSGFSDIQERHTLAVLVDNEAGVLARVIGLFSGRGYNIESLTVAEVDHEGQRSRITVVTTGTPQVIEQIKAQLALDSDGNFLASGDANGKIYLWDLLSPRSPVGHPPALSLTPPADQSGARHPRPGRLACNA